MRRLPVRDMAVLVALLAAGAPRASAADYYVSGSGNDNSAGTSAASAWRTLARVNSAAFGAGDRILLAGGQTFAGSIRFGPDARGSASAPIVLTSYGSGRATIAAGTGDAVYAYNTAGLIISNVIVVGSGRLSNTGSGVEFFTDLPGGVLLDSVRVDNVDASGFGQRGVSIGAWSGATGYRNVVVTGVAAHDNGLAGIATFAAMANVHQNVYVGYCAAYDNAGVPGWPVNSGNGIVLGNVAGATIERSSAHGNGGLSTTLDGPVGIWTYDSTGVVIQSNESYDNHTGGGDGGGFDFDQNVSNSVLQYNYSHGNDGAGFLLAQSPPADSHRNNIVRYNISQNDGRANLYAGIQVYGRVEAAEIYNNTVFVSAAAFARPRALVVASWGAPQSVGSGIHVRNNIFVATGTEALLEVDALQAEGAELLLQGNTYFAADGRWTALWGGAAFTSFDAWRAAVGQERLDAGGTGSDRDPLLSSAGAAPTVGDPMRLESIAAYRLAPGSPAIDAGVDLGAAGLSPGNRDFFNNPIAQGHGVDAGAAEAPAWAVVASPAQAFGGAAALLPGTLEAEGFDDGGEGVAYHDGSAGNAGGAFRQSDVDIEPASSGGYDVGWVSAGEWLGYTVNVTAGGTYTLIARVASPGPGGTFHVESGGVRLSPAIGIPATGGWQNWRTVSAPVTLVAGVQQLRLVMDTPGASASAVGNFDRFTFALASPPLLPGIVDASDFDDGGEGVSYHDTTEGNAGGAYRSTGVDIEPASDGGYDVGWIDRGEWLNYTVDVAAAGDYVVQLRVASPSGGGALHLGFNGPSNVWVPLAIPATGGWQNWTTVSVVVSLGAGPQQITLLFDAPGFNVRSIEVR